MKKQKKGKKGAVNNYYSRSQAIKKLRLSLVDFRRLCILKGIFPREPANTKKLSGGSTIPKTYYLAKDIAFLSHEPLLKKFREFKVFTKRLKKALARNDKDTAAHIQKSKPTYTLDHLIKERYPTFVDALRDLDDCLCLVFVFGLMPKNSSIESSVVQKCERLAAEFMHYCTLTHALRKVFVSIKGIYYQAEIKGQTVTWIVPHQFRSTVPKDVDVKVMMTFLEFYETLLGFVNFKLYHDENLTYPPTVDRTKRASMELPALSNLEARPKAPSAGMLISAASATEKVSRADKKTAQEHEARISLVKNRMIELEKQAGAEAEPEAAEREGQDSEDPVELLDEFPENQAATEAPNGDALDDVREKDKLLRVFKKLFSGCVFFLGRETPREPLEFAILCFGGKVGWGHGNDSPFGEDSEAITHQIIDRPVIPQMYMNRVYVQPQWIFDSINFRKLMPVSLYAPGAELPPHFSPFAAEDETDYVPPELISLKEGTYTAAPARAEPRKQLIQGKKAQQEQVQEEQQEEEGEGEGEEEEEEEEEVAYEESDEEAIYEQELQAEAAGIPFSSFKQNKDLLKKKAKAKEMQKKQEEREQKELSKVMMTKKTRRLYEKISGAQNRKKHYVERMQNKRKKIDEDSGAAPSKKVRTK